ncbi:MAG: hypothetical protein LBD99_04205 [Candidatus Margulisbacteria bacterium]|jgi:hypothetical protein|nr:hypothetical protein [Candidatus Margulisiibacteriota bacterium]
MEHGELIFQPQEYLEQTAAPIAGLAADVSRFEELLKRRLSPAICASKEAAVQNVIMAALEANGIQLAKPEIIIEAALCDSEVSAEIMALADKIMGGTVQ